MDWIVNLFSAYGMLAFQTVGVITSLFVLRLGIRIWKRKPEKKKASIEWAVDEAMKEDEPSAKPGSYTWDDLQKDLHDPKLTFQEILDKCGGVLPERPEDVKSETPAEKTPESTDRMKELQEWFSGRAAVAPAFKIVVPPPEARPVVVITGQPVKCPYCGGTGQKGRPGAMGGFHTAGLGIIDPPNAVRGIGSGKCDRCDGHGYVIVSGA